MSVLSFIILPKKISFPERDRFNKHHFVKQEKGFYIYARLQTGAFVEGSQLTEDFLNFVGLVAHELRLPVYFLVKSLGNNESELDFSIDSYLKADGSLNGIKFLSLDSRSSLLFDVLYKVGF